MYQPEKGEQIVLKDDILAHIGKEVLIAKGEVLVVTNVNKHAITVMTKAGKKQKIRNIPERIVPATEMGKAIYG
jgi:hypothetical protein